MPIIAAAAIVTGLVEVSAVVAGLTYASAGLYAVGKVTHNDTLMKLSAVTGLAAAGVGLYEGLTSASTLAGGGAEGADVAGGATDAADGGVTKLAADGADSAAQTFPVAQPATDTLAAAAQPGSVPLDADLAGAQNAAANPAMNGPATDIAAAPTADNADTTSQATNSLTGNTSTQPQVTGMINQPAQSSPLDLSAKPTVDSVAFKPSSSGGIFDGSSMPPTTSTDPSVISRAREFWSSLSPTEKLVAGNFLMKSGEAVENFVGPKAEMMKAQAGLANAQAKLSAANTGIINQQTANIQQPAMKIPKMTYTYTPRG